MLWLNGIWKPLNAKVDLVSWSCALKGEIHPSNSYWLIITTLSVHVCAYITVNVRAGQGINIKSAIGTQHGGTNFITVSGFIWNKGRDTLSLNWKKLSFKAWSHQHLKEQHLPVVSFHFNGIVVTDRFACGGWVQSGRSIMVNSTLIHSDTLIHSVDKTANFLSVLTFEGTQRRRVQNSGSYHSLFAVFHHLRLYNPGSVGYKLLHRREIGCRQIWDSCQWYRAQKSWKKCVCKRDFWDFGCFVRQNKFISWISSVNLLSSKQKRA